ncbi:DIP1984 family protein [Campylobacter sp. RM15925]|uniref:DIP1984 family protein n=1 Tax=Campylobacter sp. RM15925 TaxID=1705724 RepID=UPI0014732BB3|nr:DIP1984 family protein [Campylobacter sp. RM15925]
MKLAEALILRADLQKRIEQLRVRLNNNAKVQENDKVAEQPSELLKELDGCINELNSLISKINKTNCASQIEGQNLVDLIAKRDTMTMKAGILRGFIENASRKVEMYSSKEIRILSTVDVASLQKELDGISKEIRQTDTLLQRANWQVDLI